MPAGDGTGPLGLGPMTGRAAGFCAGYRMPGYINPVHGFGMGRGFFRRGGGRGWRNWFYATGLTGWQRAALFGAPFASAPISREEQLDELNKQAEYFENALKEIRKRKEEIEVEK